MDQVRDTWAAWVRRAGAKTGIEGMSEDGFGWSGPLALVALGENRHRREKLGEDSLLGAPNRLSVAPKPGFRSCGEKWAPSDSKSPHDAFSALAGVQSAKDVDPQPLTGSRSTNLTRTRPSGPRTTLRGADPAGPAAHSPRRCWVCLSQSRIHRRRPVPCGNRGGAPPGWTTCNRVTVAREREGALCGTDC
jgi:hypothetical protein